MSTFDYLTVLISIVLGLAIANVLTRLALVITARERVDFYWPPVAWAVFLFFISVQHWWAEWAVRHTQAWTFGTFWLQLLVPVDLFLLSALALPEREVDGKLDLGQWYFHNRAWFFALLFFLPALSIAEEIARTGHMASWLNLAFLLAFELAIAFAFILKARRAQEWITAQAMVMTVAYVILLYLKLPS
jgi:hypothetical protein